MDKTALYRCYNQDNALLYVGISFGALNRFNQHKYSSKWFHEVAFIKVIYFDDRCAALNAEQNAIQDEKPMMNIAHSKSSSRRILAKKPIVVKKPRPRKATLFNVFDYCGGTITSTANYLGMEWQQVAKWVHKKSVPLYIQRRLEKMSGGALKAAKK